MKDRTKENILATISGLTLIAGIGVFVYFWKEICNCINVCLDWIVHNFIILCGIGVALYLLIFFIAWLYDKRKEEIRNKRAKKYFDFIVSNYPKAYEVFLKEAKISIKQNYIPYPFYDEEKYSVSWWAEKQSKIEEHERNLLENKFIEDNYPDGFKVWCKEGCHGGSYAYKYKDEIIRLDGIQKKWISDRTYTISSSDFSENLQKKIFNFPYVYSKIFNVELECEYIEGDNKFNLQTIKKTEDIKYPYFCFFSDNQKILRTYKIEAEDLRKCLVFLIKEIKKDNKNIYCIFDDNLDKDSRYLPIWVTILSTISIEGIQAYSLSNFKNSVLPLNEGDCIMHLQYFSDGKSSRNTIDSLYSKYFKYHPKLVHLSISSSSSETEAKTQNLFTNQCQIKKDSDKILSFFKGEKTWHKMGEYSYYSEFIEKLYHVTSVRNVQSIIDNGGIYSWDLATKNNIQIKDHFHQKPISPLKKKFVHLSFCENHPILSKYNWHNTAAIIIEIAPEIAILEGTLFTNLDVDEPDCLIGNSFETLSKIDFDSVSLDYIEPGDSHYKPHLAEVLVPDFIPIRYILNMDELLKAINDDVNGYLDHDNPNRDGWSIPPKKENGEIDFSLNPHISSRYYDHWDLIEEDLCPYDDIDVYPFP